MRIQWSVFNRGHIQSFSRFSRPSCAKCFQWQSTATKIERRTRMDRRRKSGQYRSSGGGARFLGHGRRAGGGCRRSSARPRSKNWSAFPRAVRENNNKSVDTLKSEIPGGGSCNTVVSVFAAFSHRVHEWCRNWEVTSTWRLRRAYSTKSVHRQTA